MVLTLFNNLGAAPLRAGSWVLPGGAAVAGCWLSGTQALGSLSPSSSGARGNI